MTNQTDRLERIEKLLALNIANDLEELDAIEVLHKVGYNSNEIGLFTRMNPSTVRDKIADLRESGRIDD